MDGGAVPASVAIVGLGPSVATYLDLCRSAGGRKAVADETWVINGLGDILAHDRVFHMDDVRIQEIRAAAQPDGPIATMLAWLKRHPGPVYTSNPHADYPGLQAFPLQEVVSRTGAAYFNSTVAYAVAYAVFLGVRSIKLFGIDFTYANSHHAEKGRACVEYWLGMAHAAGIDIAIARGSSLMDMADDQPLYGFGALGSLDVDIQPTATGIAVTFTPRPTLPTAAEIEAAYDHSAPVSVQTAAAASLPRASGDATA